MYVGSIKFFYMTVRFIFILEFYCFRIFLFYYIVIFEDVLYLLSSKKYDCIFVCLTLDWVLHFSLVLSAFTYYLCYQMCTPGTNGGMICFRASLVQLIERSHGWLLIYPIPLYPNLLSLFLFNRRFTKSMQEGFQLWGKSL